MKSQVNSVQTSPFSLAGKVAIVTGAGSGIGSAIAQRFVEAGAKVALVGRSRSVFAQAEALGVENSHAFQLDVSNFAAIPATVAEIVNHFGRVDILVNNAGVAYRESAEGTSEETWDRTFDINLKAVFRLSQEVGSHLLMQGGGKIINISSQAALVALENHLAYCASKAALIGLTRSFALEWGPRGIQVNAISPTVVLTEMGHQAWSGAVGEAMKQQIPLRRFARPEEIADATVYLASSASDMITGTNLVIDGGYTIH